MVKRIVITALLALVFILSAFPNQAEAAEFREGATITIEVGEVIDDDVYAFAGTVTVRGTINGDLIAAGGNVNVDGTVNGDVMVVGGNVTVTGRVQDDLRIAGGNLNIRSFIGGDVVAGGGSITIEPGATIGNDLVVATGNLDMMGTVEGDVDMAAGDAIIAGVVKGNVDGEVANSLVLGPGAIIEGDLNYKSRDEAKLETGAQVLGNTTRAELAERESLGWRALGKVLSQLQWFVGITLVGLILLWLFPNVMGGVTGTPVTSPWKSLAMGFGVLIATPIPLFIITTIAIIVGGIAAVPILLVPGAAYLVLLTLAAPAIAIVIGGFALTRLRHEDDYVAWQALLLGAAILALIGFVPYLNAIVGILTILFGFGAWLLYLYRAYAEAREAQAV